MDSPKPRPRLAGLLRSFSRAIHLRSSCSPAEVKLKLPDSAAVDVLQAGKEAADAEVEDEKAESRRAAAEAVLADLFACVSAVKASYAQLQAAQSPYDGDAIQLADQAVVAELRGISELKQGYLKGYVCHSRDSTMVAELQELKSLLRTYELVARKLHNQLDSRDSEALLLRYELQESEEETRLLEAMADRAPIGCLHLSALNPTHFIGAVDQAGKSIRNFTKLMADEMGRAGWDLPSAAASAAGTSAVSSEAWAKPANRVFAFESFVCRQLFAGFQHARFDEWEKTERRRRVPREKYFEEFMAMSSAELMAGEPGSEFAEFCRVKYLGLVHPLMESSFFGKLSHRAEVGSGGFPVSDFFSAFLEMAKRVWLLHRLTFSFDPPASAFQVRSGTRFSQVYMESAIDGDGDWPVVFGERPPVVGFTVSPGFRVGKTVFMECNVHGDEEWLVATGKCPSVVGLTVSSMSSSGSTMDPGQYKAWLCPGRIVGGPTRVSVARGN